MPMYKSSGYGRKVGGRRVGAPKRRYGIRGVRGRLVRSLNPMPTFTETYGAGQIASNAGGLFAARISDIPQVAQYNTLYKQYRINWIKVMLVPDYGYDSADANAALYNNSQAVPYVGSGRIAYAINDSPQMVAPANEGDVLTDNAARIRPLRSKWSCSFKPVPDVGVTSGTTGNSIATKQKFKQWFNFDLALTGNNPLHYGISYWITQPLGPGAAAKYNVYYKVSFSLRDPQ